MTGQVVPCISSIQTQTAWSLTLTSKAVWLRVALRPTSPTTQQNVQVRASLVKPVYYLSDGNLLPPVKSRQTNSRSDSLGAALREINWWWWLFHSVREFWENVRQFIPRLRFLKFFLIKVEISSRTLIPLFMPGSVHSGSASWDDCDRMFPDELRVSSFPDSFSHYAWTAAWTKVTRQHWPRKYSFTKTRWQ